MRILIVGAGATGGYVGAMLQKGGRDVTFLLRERRAQQIREHGLEVISPHANVALQPRIVTAEQLRTTPELFHLIVFTTKAYQLEGAMDDVGPAVGPGTMLLPLLNGMGQLQTLEKRFGAEGVLGGSIRIVADLDDQGRVQQKTKLNELSYGELSGERTQRIVDVDRELTVPGLDSILQPDILATLWQKWWILASLGSICILSGGTIGAAAAVPRGPEFARAVIDECTSIAAANEYPAESSMLEDHLKRMTERGSALTSSMYRDMRKGAPVEADHVLGDLLDRAKGVAAPLLTAAYVQLKVYEAGRTQ